MPSAALKASSPIFHFIRKVINRECLKNANNNFEKLRIIYHCLLKKIFKVIKNINMHNKLLQLIEI